MAGRRVVAALALLLVSALPSHASWMTFVGRNVETGERIGLGANISNEGEMPRLAILCTPEGLTAMFDTGIVVTGQTSAMTTPVTISADGGEFDPFPVSAESFETGDHRELRLRFSADEAKGLTEYVLSAEQAIRLRYTSNSGESVETEFDLDSAAITIGAVVGECEGR